jgi:hypothetical protein
MRACPAQAADGYRHWRYAVNKYHLYRAASAVAAIVTVVVASGAGWKWA